MVEINNKILEQIKSKLNSTISNLLYGGSTDPCWNELEGAAVCFEVLRLLELEIENEEDIRNQLETDNICNKNFLEKD